MYFGIGCLLKYLLKYLLGCRHMEGFWAKKIFAIFNAVLHLRRIEN